MSGKLGRLSLFHQRFIQEYFVDLNASDAYLRAGGAATYPERVAWGMLQRPQVKAEVARRWAEEQARSQQALEAVYVTRDWVLERQKLLVQRCLQGVPVLDAKGEPTGVWRFDSQGALGGLALMRKDLGMDKEPSGGGSASIVVTLVWGGASDHPQQNVVEGAVVHP